MQSPSSSILIRAGILAALGALAVIFSACRTTPPPAVDWTINGTKWNVVELDGEMVALEKLPTFQLELNGNRLIAFGTVNQISGTYKLEVGHNGGHLTFGSIISTRMAGPEAQMKVETRFLQMLESVTGYETKGPWLALMAGDKVVARAQALPAAAFPK